LGASVGVTDEVTVKATGSYLHGQDDEFAEQDRVATLRNEGVTPGYQTVDVRAGVGLPNGITIRGGVLNVFDEYYYNHLSARNPFALPDRLPAPEPGRIFFADLALAF
jgi:outer membrane receptor protein involved in Fe transport